jgi:methylenetetrahydromethanopterin dehydrogenase
LVKDFEKVGIGYIIIEADSMIGARREFLDPVEMILYNTDAMKVLTLTGAFNVVIKVIDDIIDSIKKRVDYTLPRIIINKEIAIKNAGFNNPYAKAKALASYEIAKQAATLNIEGCFRVKEWTRYVPLVAAGHEMMRIAAKLVDEAREMEKYENSVLRKPHHRDGRTGEKRELMEKPTKV